MELERINDIEAQLLAHPQVECPVQHTFSPGVYLRTIRMPAGTFVIGHKHRTKHLNVVLSGCALVIVDGEIRRMQAPLVFESNPGVRKLLYILEDCDWATIHATDETDVVKLEEQLIEKSAAFTQHELEQAKHALESHQTT